MNNQLENQPKTVAESVLHYMRENIISNSWRAGKPLKQLELARRLNVSRIPIREAMIQLENEGFIKVIPHKGAKVADLSKNMIAELFELRMFLEGRLLEGTIPNLTDSDFAELGAILDLAKQQNDIDLEHLNTKFHLGLYQKANLPVTFRLAKAQLEKASYFIRAHIECAGGRCAFIKEHRKLLDLCEKSDITKAASYLSNHLRKTKLEVIQLYESKFVAVPNSTDL